VVTVKNQVPTNRSKGDEIYFHSHKGPMSGKILSTGKHGHTVHGDDAVRYKVKHEHVLGGKQQMTRRYSVFNQGDDGAILADEAGKRSYIDGQLPSGERYLDKASEFNIVEDGDLVTRRIELVMRDRRVYQVLSGGVPTGNVLVGCDKPIELLKKIEEKGLAPEYGVVSRTMVSGNNESHGALVGFDVDEENIQEFVSLVSSALSDHVLSVADVFVLDAEVPGMDHAIISTKDVGGRTVLFLGEQEGFDSQEVAVSKDMERLMSKSLFCGGQTILFLKSDIKNRPGLTLQEVTDKNGSRVHKWMRINKDGDDQGGHSDEPSGSSAGYGTHNIDTGDNVHFESKSGGVMEGTILQMGSDGAVVKDGHGGTHNVRWKDIRTPDNANVKKNEAAGESVDKDGKIHPDKFFAAKFFDENNQADVTEDEIFKAFPSDTKDRVAEAIARLEKIEQTIDIFTDGGNEYSEERRELHKNIINSYFSDEKIKAATPAEGELPTFTVLGGRGGSGKSWFEGKVYDQGKNIVLDADAIKGMLPEYEGWNAFQVHEESSYLFNEITNLAEKRQLNIVHDATMKTTKKAVDLIDRFKSSGYKTEAHYMHLPRQEAAKRAVARFLGKSGRFVPVGVVLSNTSNETSFDEIKKSVDKWSFRDNNVPKGSEPVLISSYRGNDDEKNSESTTGKLAKSEHGKTGSTGLSAWVGKSERMLGSQRSVRGGRSFSRTFEKSLVDKPVFFFKKQPEKPKKRSLIGRLFGRR